MLVISLPVWYKQRNANFYPAALFALQAVVMRLPWIFAESWVWTLTVGRLLPPLGCVAAGMLCCYC